MSNTDTATTSPVDTKTTEPDTKQDTKPEVKDEEVTWSDDPYLDKIRARDERSNITNDYRPPRQETRRPMLTHAFLPETATAVPEVPEEPPVEPPVETPEVTK